jgi:RNA polymerase sigma-70 factor (ECF subfamily)
MFLEHTVNCQPGLVPQRDGVTVTVFAFDIAANRIKHTWAILHSGKLRP